MSPLPSYHRDASRQVHVEIKVKVKIWPPVKVIIKGKYGLEVSKLSFCVGERWNCAQHPNSSQIWWHKDGCHVATLLLVPKCRPVTWNDLEEDTRQNRRSSGQEVSVLEISRYHYLENWHDQDIMPKFVCAVWICVSMEPGTQSLSILGQSSYKPCIHVSWK